MLSALRKQQSRDQADLDTEETALPKLESSAGQLAELLKSAEQQTAKAKAELKTAAPLIRDIRNGRVSLKGPGGEFTVQAGRIVIILAPSWNCKTMVNFGLWNTPLPPKKKQTFSAEWAIRFR